jgi:hypothetical protein
MYSFKIEDIKAPSFRNSCVASVYENILETGANWKPALNNPLYTKNQFVSFFTKEKDERNFLNTQMALLGSIEIYSFFIYR